MPEKKECHYELLGLDRKCDAEEIKKTYRKMALKMHPDKAHVTGISVEEATKNFQKIQEAYSVLSDPQERAWYDAHREQILKGHDDGDPAEDPFKTRINLYRYFSTNCFSGFGDDEGGFYAVYTDLFEQIDREEAEWEDLDSDEDHRAMPFFGRADAAPAAVSAFYRRWLDFCSRKAFGHADKWNPKDAPTRQVRRAMEAENKKERQTAKKAFNAEVRQLAKFVQKRDPRYLAQQKQQMKDSVEKKQRDLAEQEQRKAQEAVERKERLEATRLADEARWAEAEAERRARRERGEAVTDSESEEEEEEVQFLCEPCKKRFQSEKTFDQHCKTKKHLQVIASFRKELEKEMRSEAKKEKAKAAPKAAAAAARQEEEDDDDDDDSDATGTSEEDAPAQPQPKRKPEKSAAPRQDQEPQVKAEDSEEEDSDDADDLLTRLTCHALSKTMLARLAAAKREGREDLETEGHEVQDNDGASARLPGRGGGRGRGGRGARGGFAPPSRRGEGEDIGAASGGGSSSSSSEGSGSEDQPDDDEQQKATAQGNPEAAAPTAAAAAAAVDDLGGRKAQKKAQQMAMQQELLQKRAHLDGLIGGGRKAQKAAKKADAEAAAAAVAGAAGEAAAAGDSRGAASGDERCGVCGATFSSRSKLFQHIKEKGHATLKVAAPEAAAKSAKGKKKR